MNRKWTSAVLSLQCQFVSGGSGRIVVSLKVEPEHCNNYGTLHGGLSAVLVDSISTLALMPDDEKVTPRFGVSVDMHMRSVSSYTMAAGIESWAGPFAAHGSLYNPSLSHVQPNIFVTILTRCGTSLGSGSKAWAQNFYQST